jgi:hypothetical protein
VITHGPFPQAARRSVAEALVTVTIALTSKEPGTPEDKVLRLALAACARTLTGRPAAGSTQRRKRSVFCNALGYAVEQGTSPPTRSRASSSTPDRTSSLSATA